MSTDEENSLAIDEEKLIGNVDSDYYRYDYYYPSRHYSYNVTGRYNVQRQWLESDLIPRLLEMLEFWKIFLALLISIKNLAYTQILSA